MKNSVKITFVAIAIAVTAASCDPAKKTTTGTESNKPDSTTVVADSTKKDTSVTVVDSVKKDSVKK